MTWIQARSKVIIYRPCANFLASGSVLSLVTKTTPTLRSEFQQLTIRLPQLHRDGEMSPEISVINCKNILRGGLGGGDEKNWCWESSSQLDWHLRSNLDLLPRRAYCGGSVNFCDEGEDGHFLIKASFICRHSSVHDLQLNSLWP